MFQSFAKRISSENAILGLTMLEPETMQSKWKTVHGILTSSLEENNCRIVSLLPVPGCSPLPENLRPGAGQISDKWGMPSHSLLPGSPHTVRASENKPQTPAHHPGTLSSQAQWLHTGSRALASDKWKVPEALIVSAKKSLCSQGL